MLQFVQVYMHRVIHVVVHNGLTDVGSVFLGGIVSGLPSAVTDMFTTKNFEFKSC